MILIKSNTQNPYFNLAAEEYFLKQNEDDVFYIYINSPSIIIGKHQNTLAEINYKYVEANNIKVVRRMTGGGAVFHDPGNINFTFIIKHDGDEIVDFSRFTKPIIDVLRNNLGINAELKGRNDLVIDDKKFSGNAKLIYKDKVLQHGTILYASKMGDLSAALKSNPLKFKDKAVKSVRSRVTNISTYLNKPVGQEDFVNMVFNHITDLYPNAKWYDLKPEDIHAINKLVDEKYSSWNWNYGSSPDYNLSRGFKAKGGNIEIHMDVQNGIMERVKIFGDFFAVKDITQLEQLLTGTEHSKEIVLNKLKTIDLNDYFGAVDKNEFIDVMF